MFHVLIESGAHPGERRAGWTMTSAAVHAGLIAVAVALTLRNAPERPEPIRTDDVIWSKPQETAPERGSGGAGPIVAPRIPDIPIPDIPVDPPINWSGTVPIGPHDDYPFVFKDVWGVEGHGAGPVRTVPTGVYTVGAVDRAVALRNDNGSPVFPAILRSAGVEGGVGVRYIVDSTGRVEAKSIAILETTHAAFAEAVGRWLLRARYLPAEVNGRPVRQLVEQRFAFTLLRRE
ncbi:MAG TPA: TonB family protein [Gemmatimonadaceae bacterium]|nr:TonB family protein [Gemmatimonadaceae bacterium]